MNERAGSAVRYVKESLDRSAFPRDSLFRLGGPQALVPEFIDPVSWSSDNETSMTIAVTEGSASRWTRPYGSGASRLLDIESVLLIRYFNGCCESFIDYRKKSEVAASFSARIYI